jgi:hypothetical protein
MTLFIDWCLPPIILIAIFCVVLLVIGRRAGF